MPDAKGMAVKLLGVPGETCLPETVGEHDFVMVNTPTVWFGTEALMMEYARKVRGSMGSSPTPKLFDTVPLAFLFPGGNPLNARWNMVRLARRICGRASRTGIRSATPISPSPHSASAGGR